MAATYFHTFEWEHPAGVVYVTGTFDNWSKSERLQWTRDGILAKRVRLTLGEDEDKVVYKFVVDGDWRIDPRAPIETESNGTQNNVLYKHQLEPEIMDPTFNSASAESTTASLAAQVPKEDRGDIEANNAANSGSAPQATGVDLESKVVEREGVEGIEGVNGLSPNDATAASVAPSQTDTGLAKPYASGLETHAFISGPAPQSTTAELAAQVPIESSSTARQASKKESKSKPEASTPAADAVPGFFPETPVTEKENPQEKSKTTEKTDTAGTAGSTKPQEDAQMFSVNPLPASDTAENPIDLAPGQPVPRDIGTQSLNSQVKLDRASYEAGATNYPIGNFSLPNPVTPAEQREREGRGVLDFQLPPIGASMIPESSLPIVSGTAQAPGASTVQAVPGVGDVPVVPSSANPQTLTTAAAPHGTATAPGVPGIVAESQELAHVSPEAAADIESVAHKVKLEEELQHEVPVVPAVGETTGPDVTETAKNAANTAAGVAKTAADNAVPVAQTAAQTAKEYTQTAAEYAVPAAQNAAETAKNAANTAAEYAKPAAETAVETAKNAVNATAETAQNATGAVANTVASVAASAGLSSALGYQTPKEELDAEVPEVVKESQDRANEPPEASAVPIAVEKKAEVEKELQAEVPLATPSGNGATLSEQAQSALSTAAGAVTGAASTAANTLSGTAGAATEALSGAGQTASNAASGLTGAATNAAAATGLTSVGQESYPSPVAEVPGVVKDSLEKAHAPPEAAANQDSVQAKDMVEQELSSTVIPAAPDAVSFNPPARGPPSPATEAQKNADYTLNQSVPTVTDGVVTSTTQKTSGDAALDFPTKPLKPAREEVPDAVVDSLATAGTSAEAASELTAIHHKRTVEDEIKNVVEPAGATAESETTQVVPTSGIKDVRSGDHTRTIRAVTDIEDVHNPNPTRVVASSGIQDVNTGSHTTSGTSHAQTTGVKAVSGSEDVAGVKATSGIQDVTGDKAVTLNSTDASNTAYTVPTSTDADSGHASEHSATDGSAHRKPAPMVPQDEPLTAAPVQAQPVHTPPAQSGDHGKISSDGAGAGHTTGGSTSPTNSQKKRRSVFGRFVEKIEDKLHRRKNSQ